VHQCLDEVHEVSQDGAVDSEESQKVLEGEARAEKEDQEHAEAGGRQLNAGHQVPTGPISNATGF
jgi:hypothetical protein